MSETIFDHDRLAVYRLAVEYTAESCRVAQGLPGLHRHARDQWLRAARSIPRKIAEGNGKRSLNDQARFLDIARGSAVEWAAIQDVFAASGGLNTESSLVMKRELQRLVSMLSRMALKCDCVAETQAGDRANSDYEHRFAEHRHEHESATEPEPAYPREAAAAPGTMVASHAPPA